MRPPLGAMALSNRIPDLFKQFRRTILIVGGVALLIWFFFLDSYSFLNRIELHREMSRLTEQNKALSSQISELREKLDRDLSDEEIERIAREQHNMRRSNEKVYLTDKE